MKRIEKCRSCGSRNVEQFFDMGAQPFANALLMEDELADERRYPLSLSYCHDCSLVQLDYTADPTALFSNYFWVTSTSSTAVNYADYFYKEALRHQQVADKNYVLEIASNDGTFLKPFVRGGCHVLGVDPAANIAKKANEEGIRTRVDFFGSEVAEDIIRKEGYPSIVFARNVMPHVADLNDFVKGISVCCNEHNLLIIEVHYSGTIVSELHYDSIYHEHLCYFTLQSVTNILKKYGLYAYDVMQSPISGGSIVLYIRKNQERKTEQYLKLEQFEKEQGYNTLKRWRTFAVQADVHREQLQESIEAETNAGHTIVGYGASARSSTMLNYCGIAHKDITAIIDQNILKQGRLTPGTHIPICNGVTGMNYNPDTILLLAWNFRDEVLRILKKEYAFKGKVIVPLPFPLKEEFL